MFKTELWIAGKLTLIDFYTEIADWISDGIW